MDITGVSNLANGGTSANLTASNGGIFYFTASAAAILAGTSTAKKFCSQDFRLRLLGQQLHTQLQQLSASYYTHPHLTLLQVFQP